ncbi:MAG TPA: NAD(P)H-binding protein [Actinocatenispora sp.]
MTTTVLVTGGTGRLGREVVARLAGDPPRVLTRDATRAGAGDVAVGDLRTGAGVAAAVAGVRTVVHCATTNGRGDVVAARSLVAAARATAPHLVYASIVGIEDVPLPYYRAKLAAERVIAGSGLPYTILRTTQFHPMVGWMCRVQRWLPVVALPAMPLQPVDVGEVADRVVELAAGPPAGRVPDLGGPEVRWLTDLARAWLRATGRRRPVVGLRLPGATMAAYRRGGHLAPDRAVGTVTFADYLAEGGR